MEETNLESTLKLYGWLDSFAKIRFFVSDISSQEPEARTIYVEPSKARQVCYLNPPMNKTAGKQAQSHDSSKKQKTKARNKKTNQHRGSFSCLCLLCSDSSNAIMT